MSKKMMILLFDVIHNIFARTKSILDVLKVVTENSCLLYTSRCV